MAISAVGRESKTYKFRILTSYPAIAFIAPSWVIIITVYYAEAAKPYNTIKHRIQ